jgi:hypothetical protein
MIISTPIRVDILLRPCTHTYLHTSRIRPIHVYMLLPLFTPYTCLHIFTAIYALYRFTYFYAHIPNYFFMLLHLYINACLNTSIPAYLMLIYFYTRTLMHVYILLHPYTYTCLHTSTLAYLRVFTYFYARLHVYTLLHLCTYTTYHVYIVLSVYRRRYSFFYTWKDCLTFSNMAYYALLAMLLDVQL